MTTAIASVDAAAAVLKRDIIVFRSYRLRFLGAVLTGFASVALIYYISRLVSVQPFENPDQYFAFAVVGLVIVEILFSTIGSVPARVRQELVAGTFEKFVVSPFGAAAGVVSTLVFPFLLAFVSGTVTIAFAVLAFGMPLEWSTAPYAVPLAILGCLCFAPFALLAGAAAIYAKQAQSGVGFMMMGIAFIAGFLFPVSLLPGWIQWTSDVQPFTPLVDLLRRVLVGTPLEGDAWVALLKIGLFVLILLPLATWVLAAAIRKSQRNGTIIEY